MQITYRCENQLPEYNKSVLIWDSERKDWYKAKLLEMNGDQVWVIEPKLFYTFNSNKFTHWTNLPEKING